MSGRSAVRILLPVVSTNFSRDLVDKFAPSREAPAERLDETLVTLPPFRPRRRLCGIRQWRRAGQPEADEQSQRLVGNVDVCTLTSERVDSCRWGRGQTSISNTSKGSSTDIATASVR
jgi:hypothetical protein